MKRALFVAALAIAGLTACDYPVIPQGPRPGQPGYVPQGDGPAIADVTACDVVPDECAPTHRASSSEQLSDAASAVVP